MKNKQDRNDSLAILNVSVFYHITYRCVRLWGCAFVWVCVCAGVCLCGCAFVRVCVCMGVHFGGCTQASQHRSSSQGTTFPNWLPPSTMGSQIEVTSSGLHTKPSCWAHTAFVSVMLWVLPGQNGHMQFQDDPRIYQNLPRIP